MISRVSRSTFSRSNRLETPRLAPPKLSLPPASPPRRKLPLAAKSKLATLKTSTFSRRRLLLRPTAVAVLVLVRVLALVLEQELAVPPVLPGWTFSATMLSFSSSADSSRNRRRCLSRFYSRSDRGIPSSLL
jgi:hypothetical protein